MKTMQRRRPSQPRDVRNEIASTDDLFDPSRQSAPILVAPAPTDDEFWSVRTIMAKTGLARSTIYLYVKHGLFPRQRRLAPGRVGWLASEVRTWITSR
jgi:prophage regulatory protein